MTRNPKIETFGGCRRSFAGWPPGALALPRKSRALLPPLAIPKQRRPTFPSRVSACLSRSAFHAPRGWARGWGLGHGLCRGLAVLAARRGNGGEPARSPLATSAAGVGSKPSASASRRILLRHQLPGGQVHADRASSSNKAREN